MNDNTKESHYNWCFLAANQGNSGKHIPNSLHNGHRGAERLIWVHFGVFTVAFWEIFYSFLCLRKNDAEVAKVRRKPRVT